MSWQEGVAQSDAELDNHFGEQFELIPRLAGKNSKGTSDPDRRSFCFIGIYYDDASTIDGAATHDRRSTQPAVSVQNTCIEDPIKHKDWLKQFCTGKIWEVAYSAEDGKTRTEFYLVETGRDART
ncbi:MAG: hypothetical protein ABJO09_01005 [Hyphomicrobiales bacterium]